MSAARPGGPGGSPDPDASLRLRRMRFAVLGSAVLLFGVAGTVAGVVAGAWGVVPSTVLLAVAGGLIVWMSRWLPSPTATQDPLQRRALVVILVVLACIVGGSLLFPLLTGD